MAGTTVGPLGHAPPIDSTDRWTAESASAEPVIPAITERWWCSAMAWSRWAWPDERRWGRKRIVGPRSASTGGEVGMASTAARTRSCSSLNLGRSRSLTARCTRTTSAVRGDVAARRSSPVGPTSDRVRCARTSERSVAGWEATPPKCPGSSASTARTAPASTGVERGRRPVEAMAAAPRSSASR